MTVRDPISRKQRAALSKLAALLHGDFYLAGGIAIAAHFSHRTSRDLDLFALVDPAPLESDLERLPGVTIESRTKGTVYLDIDGIPASLIQYPYPLLIPPEPRAQLPVPVASIDDLACMKLSAISSRGLARDFWDLHTIMTRTGRPLLEFLEAFRRKYPVKEIGHVVQSLAYFGDAGPLPSGLTAPHWEQIQRDFERWVRAVLPELP